MASNKLPVTFLTGNEYEELLEIEDEILIKSIELASAREKLRHIDDEHYREGMEVVSIPSLQRELEQLQSEWFHFQWRVGR